MYELVGLRSRSDLTHPLSEDWLFAVKDLVGVFELL